MIVLGVKTDTCVEYNEVVGHLQQVFATNSKVWQSYALKAIFERTPTCHCDHPWCATLVLMTHPIDQTFAPMFKT